MAQTLEKRVSSLEKQISKLVESTATGIKWPDWRSTIGVFTDDPQMQQILSSALKIRKGDRKRASRATAGKKTK